MTEIKLFGLAMEWNNFDYKTISKLWLKVGYLIDPKCSTTDVYHFLETQKKNTNTTFYKTWEQVTNKSRFELFLDQITHYATTYGTNFKWIPFIPNDSFWEDIQANFKEYKYIKAATKEEIIEKANEMLNSWIALSDETLNDIFKIYDKFYYVPNIENIKNKEAKMKICLQKNILPTEPVEFIRYLVFLATKSTLLIKDRTTLDTISISWKNITELVEKFWIKELSSIFFRFKSIFLAFKHANRNNVKIVNKLRKLADKNKKPYKFWYFENLLNNLDNVYKLPEKINELNNFKKVSLINAIRNKLSDSIYNAYIIRNWRVFVKENNKRLNDKEVNTYKLMEGIIYKALVDDIKTKHSWKTFFIPEYLNIKVPTSEKTFIWNIPFWTEVKTPEKDLVIGINWKEKDWTHDFDLSFNDINGSKIGWNSSYNKDWVVYSGDMTSANPEATELLYFSNKDIDWIVKNNRYNWIVGSKYKFFIAIEDKDKIKINHMVKNENIIFQTELESIVKEDIIWIKKWDKFIFQKIKMWNKMVSTNDNVSDAYLKYVLNKQEDLLNLEDILIEAWLKKVKDVKGNENVDFDLQDIHKDTIISILS